MTGAVLTHTSRLSVFTGRINPRIAMLMAALVLYGAAGSPTPDNPGLLEALTGVLLVLSAGGAGAVLAFRRPPRAPWRKSALALALYGLSVPVLAGLINGSDVVPMIRDIIPFLFLLLPFFVTIPADDGACRVPLTAAIVLSGMLFALRVVLPLLGHDAFWHPLTPADPFYLANAPTVLFACLLLIGLAGRELYQGAGVRRVCRAALLAAAAFFPLVAMMLVTQRASMGIVFSYGAFFLASAFIRNPARAALPLLAVLAVTAAGWDIGAGIVHTAVQKTELVGVNMRWQEAAAVFDRLGYNPLTILFGRGWGATVASPAVGGVTVNFTHSLLTSYWLKTGLCGLALVLAYLFRLGVLLARLFPARPLLAAAIAGPLLIDISLYASFKSLDFGLILLLIPLWAGTGGQLHKKPGEYSISPDFQ